MPVNTSINAIEYDFTFDKSSRSNPVLKLINNSSTPITLQNVTIQTNANITSAWGTIGSQWVNATKTQNNNFYTYTLNLNPPITLQPGINDNMLVYSVQTALGPVTNVAMAPQQITAQIQGQTFQIPLTNPKPQNNPHSNVQLNMYHADWGQYSYGQDMTTESFTDINCLSYAFIGFDVNGNVFSLDNWGDQLELPLMQLAKQRRPYLKTSLSFGGWTNAGQRMDTVFSAMAASANTRTVFVNNVVNAVIQASANDVNIDWEYPETPADAANFVLLLQNLRTALNNAGLPNVTLSIAAPAGVDKINIFTKDQWQQIAALTDKISIMTYDYFGAFSDVADFHAPWNFSQNSPHKSSQYCVEDTLNLYDQMGVPRQKLALGFPNYARAMIVAQPGNFGGLYQPIIGTPDGDFPGCGGIYGWNQIQKCLNHQPSSLDKLGVKNWNYYDSTHPFCVDANMAMLSGQMPNGQWVVMTFLDPASATNRAQQVMQRNMGGAMVWANYTESTDNSIVGAISSGLNAPNKKLQKDEKYDAAKHVAQDRVKKRQTYLQTAFFAADKRDILKQLETKDNFKDVKMVIDKNRAKLAEHRNVIKFLLVSFVAIFSERESRNLFTKSKSLQLAEQLLASYAPSPTRIIACPVKNVAKNSAVQQVQYAPLPPNVIPLKSNALSSAAANAGLFALPNDPAIRPPAVSPQYDKRSYGL